MPVVSPLRLPASQAMDDLTLKHWSEFTALFASLSAEMQADLWAKGTALSLPDFPTRSSSRATGAPRTTPGRSCSATPAPWPSDRFSTTSWEAG